MSVGGYLLVDKIGTRYEVHIVGGWAFPYLFADAALKQNITVYELFVQSFTMWAKKGSAPELVTTKEGLQPILNNEKLSDLQVDGKDFSHDCVFLVDRDQSDVFQWKDHERQDSKPGEGANWIKVPGSWKKFEPQPSRIYEDEDGNSEEG